MLYSSTSPASNWQVTRPIAQKFLNRQDLFGFDFINPKRRRENNNCQSEKLATNKRYGYIHTLKGSHCLTKVPFYRFDRKVSKPVLDSFITGDPDSWEMYIRTSSAYLISLRLCSVLSVPRYTTKELLVPPLAPLIAGPSLCLGSGFSARRLFLDRILGLHQ